MTDSIFLLLIVLLAYITYVRQNRIMKMSRCNEKMIHALAHKLGWKWELTGDISKCPKLVRDK